MSENSTEAKENYSDHQIKVTLTCNHLIIGLLTTRQL